MDIDKLEEVLNVARTMVEDDNRSTYSYAYAFGYLEIAVEYFIKEWRKTHGD